MDTFIISKFEYIFNKSFISPYLTARLFIAIAFLIGIYENRNNINSITSILIFIVICVMIYNLWMATYSPELKNKKQYSNTLKEDYRHLRTYIFIAWVFSTFTLIQNQVISINIFFGLLTWTIYLYLISIEWTKPIKNSLDRRWPGARILSNIKRKN